MPEQVETMSQPTAATNVQSGGIHQDQKATEGLQAEATEGAGLSQQQPQKDPPADKVETVDPLKLPEGLSEADLKQVEEFAKANKLSNEQAQAILERDLQLQNGFKQQLESQIEQTKTEWITQSEQDKEIGGVNFKQNAEVARQALDRFATPELKELLNKTGLGNHPEMVRVFARFGKAMSDDKFHGTGAAVSTDLHAKDVLFGKRGE